MAAHFSAHPRGDRRVSRLRPSAAGCIDRAGASRRANAGGEHPGALPSAGVSPFGDRLPIRSACGHSRCRRWRCGECLCGHRMGSGNGIVPCSRGTVPLRSSAPSFGYRPGHPGNAGALPVGPRRHRLRAAARSPWAAMSCWCRRRSACRPALRFACCAAPAACRRCSMPTDRRTAARLVAIVCAAQVFGAASVPAIGLC